MIIAADLEKEILDYVNLNKSGYDDPYYIWNVIIPEYIFNNIEISGIFTSNTTPPILTQILANKNILNSIKFPTKSTAPYYSNASEFFLEYEGSLSIFNKMTFKTDLTDVGVGMLINTPSAITPILTANIMMFDTFENWINIVSKTVCNAAKTCVLTIVGVGGTFQSTVVM